MVHPLWENGFGLQSPHPDWYTQSNDHSTPRLVHPIKSPHHTHIGPFCNIFTNTKIKLYGMAHPSIQQVFEHTWVSYHFFQEPAISHVQCSGMDHP